MAVQSVTSEKMERRDFYRLQVNADKALIAFGYNAMVGYLPQSVMEHIRNALVATLNKELEHELSTQIIGRPGFDAFLSLYLIEYIDPSLHEEAKALYRRLGWSG